MSIHRPNLTTTVRVPVRCLPVRKLIHSARFFCGHLHDNHPGGAEDAHGRTRTATHKAHDTCTARGRPLTKRNGSRGRARAQRGRRAQGTRAPHDRSATAAWPSREGPRRRPRGRRRRVRSPLSLRLSDRGVVRAPEVVRARVDHAHVPADRRHAAAYAKI